MATKNEIFAAFEKARAEGSLDPLSDAIRMTSGITPSDAPRRDYKTDADEDHAARRMGDLTLRLMSDEGMTFAAAQTASAAILSRTSCLRGVTLRDAAPPMPTSAGDITLRLREIDPSMSFDDAQSCARRIAASPGAMAMVELRAAAGEAVESTLRRLHV